MNATVVIIAVCFCAYFAFENEQLLKQVERQISRNCLATKTGERAVSERKNNGDVTCSRYMNAGYARVPRLVSADVWTE